MRFRRRRFKPKVTWLPSPGTFFTPGQAGSPTENPAALEFTIGSSNAGPQTVAAPLVVDQPVAETTAGSPLTVWQSLALNQTLEWGYKLRRVVGDIFLSAAPTQDGDDAGAVLVEAGIIVRRVQSDGGPAVQAVDQDVGTIDNEQDPWIWRQNWVLGREKLATGSSSISLEALSNFPRTNQGIGVKGYAKIDQKTFRTVGKEERLFLNLTVWNLPLAQTTLGTPTSDWAVYFLMPYRVLGTRISPSVGNRGNASR